MTNTVQSVSHTTVAVRGPWSSSDSSPTIAPGPSVATLRPLRCTDTDPVEHHERLAAGLALVDEQRCPPSSSISSPARARRSSSLWRAPG